MVQSVERRMVRREEAMTACAICGSTDPSKRILLDDSSSWIVLCLKCHDVVKRADDRAVVS